MENKGEEIKELLSHILNKLDRLEQKIERQEEDIRIFLTSRDSSYEPSSLVPCPAKGNKDLSRVTKRRDRGIASGNQSDFEVKAVNKARIHGKG